MAAKTQKAKYVMKMSLEVLKHLGFNLYSNIPAVLSEVVANAYDADADTVKIKIEDDKITIEDDGNGMDLNDINNKFLLVGYQKRKDKEGKKDKAGNSISPKHGRRVMGRKGIGKLSLFSIADNIEIYTIKKSEKNGFVLNRQDIEEQINTTEQYFPKEVPLAKLKITKGTRIIITKLKKNVSHTEAFLRKRIAKRFSVINDKFKITVNNEPITIADRDYFNKLQFFWLIGKEKDIYSPSFKFEKTNTLEGNLTITETLGKKKKETKASISGWIGSVRKPAELNQDEVNNNKISIICNGKLWLEDILPAFNESGIYATYLIGEITADFLDTDYEDDIATSSRQSINEDDPRYIALTNHIYKLLKEIKAVWGDMRIKSAEKTALQEAKSFNPVLEEWFKTLKTAKSKEYALTLFATINTFHFDKGEEVEKKKILYSQGIMAFEKLRLKDNLQALSKIKGVDDIHLSPIFTDINDIEASMYYDIVEQRIKIIREFKEKLDVNEKEKLIQKYLFDNLWLLDPSWERATEGSEIMEQRVSTAFNKVISTLSEDERKARFDIRYRTANNKHIIVELKRFIPGYSIDSHSLAKQAEKYREALSKCLSDTGHKSFEIEVIIVLGETLKEDRKKVSERLKVEDARIIYYDELIEKSLSAYQTYLDKQKQTGYIKKITNTILEA